MEFYRKSFPSATFLPKLHLLEDHIVPWIKQWKVGCGIMGEQGAESLHASFNCTERAFNSMKDRVERLKVLLQNHQLQIQPTNTSLEPPLLKKRKTKTRTNRRELTEQSYIIYLVLTIINHSNQMYNLVAPSKKL